MDKTAIFPGSFDPFTLGHQSVVERALNLFDKLVIGIGVNSKKQYLFSLEQRKQSINELFKSFGSRVEVIAYEGLTVDYCKNHNIKFIVRGIRNSRDFHMEYEIANMNRTLFEGVESVFLASIPEHTAINSTIVREILRNGGDVSKFLPADIRLPDISIQ